MKFKKLLLISFILSLPYNNFPYGIGGTLTPLALIPGSVFIFLSFVNFCLRGVFKFNKNLLLLVVVFVYFIIITIFNDIRFYEYFVKQKIVSPWFRTFQFIIYSLISIISFYIGYRALQYIRSFNKLIKIILYAYIPSLVFGILEIITNNHSILNLIRKFFASTQFPDGYYRIYLLTTEPSWAGFDMISYVIPITMYLLLKERSKIYLVLLIIELVIFLEIKSLLAAIVFAILFVAYFLVSIIYEKKVLSLLIAFFTIVIFLIGLHIFRDIYWDRFQDFLQGNDSSALTRTVTYIIAVKILINEPMIGVGFRNSGYFYTEYINPLLLSHPLIRDWADFWSKRFPDIKSTMFEIVASVGVQGIVFFTFFLTSIIKKILFIKDREALLLFLMIFLASFIGSFSLNLIGYPIFWFFIGLLYKFSGKRNKDV